MIYTAPCIMFLMWADTLRGQVVWSWALEMESFFGPWKWRVFWALEVESFLGPVKWPGISITT
jgi:hypothetical protein